MIVCDACGTENPGGFNFCGKCGSALTQAQPVAQERKVVTSLFCDLVGFTAMSERADPEDVDALLARYFALAKAQIEAHGGVVEKFIGDAVVGVFGVPAAHEDDAERGVRAGLRIVEGVEELSRPDGTPLQVRVGINTGPALVRLNVVPGSGDGFLTGDAVNTAARIQSVAPEMGVAVGQMTYEATRLVFDYAELPPEVVKGKSEPVLVWRAMAPLARFGTEITRRHDAPLVGREIDLAILKGVFDKTVASSNPQLVTVVGEPGLGKSRLVAETFGYIDQLPYLVTWRQGRCLPYGEGITFWALGEIVKAQAGILETDSPRVALDKLDLVLPDNEERAWLRRRLAPLLGMEASSGAEQLELFTAWRRFLEHIAEANPTVLVFEDLHWADPALLAFIEHVADHVDGVPLLIVGTARPELFEHHHDYGRGLRNVVSINLTPLTTAETNRLVAALLDATEVPAELQGPLVERAGGNPLFAEEYVRLLRDQGLIERVDGAVKVKVGADVPLPDNVHALLAARLDTLDADRKGLLADAAVVGRVFWAGAVAAMSGIPEPDVIEVMRELSRKELVRPVRRPTMAGQVEYSFHHALARDVAYAQLPRTVRAGRHIAAAQWLEEQAGDRLEDLADVLAHHYATALELANAAGDQEQVTQVEPVAVRFLLLAGERTLGLDAAAALTNLQHALTLTPTGHPLRAHALVRYGQAALQTGHLSEAQEALEESATLFRDTDDIPATVEALAQLREVLQDRGDPRWSVVPTEALALVAALPPGPVHVQVYTELAAVEGIMEHHESALEYANRALGLADELGIDPPPRAFGYRAAARICLGDDEGLADYHDAIARATAAGQGRDVAVMYNWLGVDSVRSRGAREVVEVFQDGVAYTKAHGLTEMGNRLSAGSMEVLLSLGELAEILELATELAPQLEAADDQWSLQDLRSVQARALMLRGESERCVPWLDWLAATGRETGDPPSMAIGIGAAALVWAALGDQQAVKLLEELAENPAVCTTINAAVQLPFWTRALISLGNVDLAERLSTTPATTFPCLAHALMTSHAAIAEARGQHAEALAGYRDAVRRFRDFGSVTEEAFALLGEGRCLITLGQAHEAVGPLKQAHDIFHRMGARPTTAEIESLLSAIRPR